MVPTFDSNVVLDPQAIWNMDLDGYTRTLNPLNLNYFKDPLERKKFRHYWNKILLKRNPIPIMDGLTWTGEFEPEVNSMVFKVENTNINLSFR